MSATTMTTSLTCDEVEALLPLVVDGVLHEADEPELFAHLAACPRCQHSLAAHDLVELALSGGRPLSPAHGSPQVVHYSLPWPWAVAACALLAMTAGLLMIGKQAVAEPGRSAHTAHDGIQILEVLPAGPNREQPVFVIRDGDAVRVISGDQLDGGLPAQRPAHVQPVTHGRFHDIRHLGAID